MVPETGGGVANIGIGSPYDGQSTRGSCSVETFHAKLRSDSISRATRDTPFLGSASTAMFLQKDIFFIVRNNSNNSD